MNIFRLALVLTLMVQGLSSAWAQVPGGDQMDAQSGPAGSPPPPPPRMNRPDGERGVRKFMEDMPPEIRERFKQARDKALQDPKMQELQKQMETVGRAFREAMRAKMQEIDPSLADYVKKEAAKFDGGDGPKGPAPKGPAPKDAAGKTKGPDGGGIAKLTDSEREKYLAARAKAKGDPTVEAAKAKLEAATTPDERHAAGEEYGKAMKEAILKIDPSLKATLDKVSPPPSAPLKAPPSAPSASAPPAQPDMEMN